MHIPSRLIPSALCLLLPVAAALSASAAPTTLADFQALAAKSHTQLVLPTYPLTPADVKAQAENAIRRPTPPLMRWPRRIPRS